jgi:hypothetical protein
LSILSIAFRTALRHALPLRQESPPFSGKEGKSVSNSRQGMTPGYTRQCPLLFVLLILGSAGDAGAILFRSGYDDYLIPPTVRAISTLLYQLNGLAHQSDEQSRHRGRAEKELRMRQDPMNNLRSAEPEFRGHVPNSLRELAVHVPKIP